ncbi:MAG: FAD-dependent oxidoreductase [Alphaproteobacteria bacterium]|nr:FAD-dependent oxidoreductase [Alphaproteobacteria bacterium]
MKVVIVGGGAAGASCAARLRRLNETAEILMFEKTDEVSIANCGLPYYFSGVITDREDMLVSSPEELKSLFNIDVQTNSEVTKIDFEKKIVEVNSEKIVSYDKLVLALGASPIVPPIKGMGANVFSVRNLHDIDKLKAFAKQNPLKSAVVIGGGFIGLEMAENFAHLNIKTTLIEQASQILAPLDEDVVAFAQNEMRTKAVELILGDGVKEFEADNVVLNSGRKIQADVIVMAIGVRPDTRLLQNTSVALNERGAVKVNVSMETSVKDVYAAGDSVEIRDFVSKAPAMIALAGPANRQGRIIADNLCGKHSTYKDTQGTAVVKVFDLTVASVGLNERQLKQKEIAYKKVHIWGNSHAGYYPDAQPLLLKLLFTGEGEILGAQAVGYDAVEKRIDVIASIMRLSGKVQDLVDAELCYAPPYSSAKDPVNILGMAASNIIAGDLSLAFYEDVTDEAYLLDIRPLAAYKAGTIKGAKHLHISKLRENLGDLPKDKKIILFCNKGFNSYLGYRILKQNGFENIYSLSGGFLFFSEQMQNKS